jgi:hypothetical protein
VPPFPPLPTASELVPLAVDAVPAVGAPVVPLPAVPPDPKANWAYAVPANIGQVAAASMAGATALKSLLLVMWGS